MNNRFLLFVCCLLYSTIALCGRVDTISVDFTEVQHASFYKTVYDDADMVYAYDDTIFVKFNILVDTLNKKLYAFYFGDAEIQELQLGGETFYTGKYQDVNKLFHRYDNRHFTVPLEALKTGKGTAKLYNLTDYKIHVHPRLLLSQAVDSEIIDITLFGTLGILFTMLFLGGIIVFWIYFWGGYLRVGNRDLLYYSMYIGTVLFYTVFQLDAFLKLFFFFPKNPIVYHYFFENVLFHVYIFFMIFTLVFLELKTELPKVYKVFKFGIFLSSFCAVILFVLSLNHLFYVIKMYGNLMWIIPIVFGVYTVVQTIRLSKNPLRYYLITGTFFLLLGSFIEVYFTYSNPDLYHWNLYGITPYRLYQFNFAQFGMVLQIICFAFALNVKYELRSSYISRFQKRQIKELQTHSKERESELEALTQSIASEKLLRKEAFELSKLIESKYGVIKYQLNPDFVFNNLNAINYLVMKNETKGASEYLISFSKLLRDILKKSDQKLISIQNELIIMEKYLNLEQRRLSNRFEYSINTNNIEGRIDLMVPPFVLQNYLGYCLGYHLVNPERANTLEIDINLENNILHIQVIDNGEVISFDTPELNEIIDFLDKRLNVCFAENQRKPIVLIQQDDPLNILSIQIFIDE